MISEVVLHVYRNRGCYNPQRAKESTWVWHVADNKCKVILSHYRKMKYEACSTIEITNEMSVYLTSPKTTLERREAIDTIERVIELGSEAARDLLEKIFTGRAPRYPDPDAVDDLKKTARRCSAKLRDFELVYRAAVR